LSDKQEMGDVVAFNNSIDHLRNIVSMNSVDALITADVNPKIRNTLTARHDSDVF